MSSNTSKSSKSKAANKAESKKAASKKAESKSKADPKAAPKLPAPIAAVQEGFTNLARAFIGTAAEQAALNTRRTGNYSGTVDLAILCKDADTFAGQYDLFKDRISRNVDGIAVALGCAANEKSKGAYNIPGGLRTAVSVVLSAMRYGVSLTSKDGQPRSYTDIKKAKDQAVAEREKAESRAKMSPLDVARERIAALCDALKGAAGGMTLDDTVAAEKILSDLIAAAASKGHADKAKKAA